MRLPLPLKTHQFLSCVKKCMKGPLPPPYPGVSLFYWQPPSGQINFGDHLSKIIVEKILSSRDLSLEEETSRPARLLAVGSILHYAQNGDTIWGSGVNGKISPDAFAARRLNIAAVRGPLTADFLRKRGFEVPDIFGDPAFLAASLFKDRFRPAPQQDHIFIPNLHDLPQVKDQPFVVSPLSGWNVILEKIMGAKLVLSSSLHGLIIAEAFNIPARYVRLSETEPLFKYEDYFLGTRRSGFSFARSIAEGLEMGGMAPPSAFDPAPLLAAFPWKLWDADPAR